MDYRSTVTDWEDRDGGQWFTRLWWASIDDRLRCVGVEVRSFSFPDDPERGRLPDDAPLLELTDTRLRGLRFGRLERETRQAEAFFARRAGLADVELWQHGGGRGRPALSGGFLAAVLEEADGARDHGDAQVPAIRAWAQKRWPERWGTDGPDDSTIGRWLQRARRAQKEG